MWIVSVREITLFLSLFIATGEIYLYINVIVLVSNTPFSTLPLLLSHLQLFCLLGAYPALTNRIPTFILWDNQPTCFTPLPFPLHPPFPFLIEKVCETMCKVCVIHSFAHGLLWKLLLETILFLFDSRKWGGGDRQWYGFDMFLTYGIEVGVHMTEFQLLL